MRKFIINLLGGWTLDDVYDFMDHCEDFAKENLQPKDGGIAPDCSMYKPYHGDDLCILRSDIRILSGTVKQLKFAPWCRNVVAREIDYLDHE